ncbi:unannotated protein [freshwater metagenome]|uniref:Unannotated protein n=1 Tax=freshwater metagenome TaxID=449393 RepID=A0A6J7J652_9ZZZZ
MGAGAFATLVLLGGAVAASYAALSDDPPPPRTRVETVAEVTPAPAPAQEVPLPKEQTVDPSELDPPPAELTGPIDPATTDPLAPPPAPETTPDLPSDPPKDPPVVEILPAAGAGTLYDPSLRASATGDPQRALDGNTGTSWFATAPADAGGMQVGYLIDLAKRRSLSRLRLVTKTPGFTVTLYGARGGVAPRTVVPDPARPNDPVWTSLAEAGSVDGDGPEGVVDPVKPVEGDKAGDRRLDLMLELGDQRYRWLLLWVTVPPLAGPTVRFSEIQLWA